MDTINPVGFVIVLKYNDNDVWGDDMKKITFGTPEKIVPSNYCKGLNYQETEIKYNTDNFKF